MAQYINKADIVTKIDGRRDEIKKGIFSIPLTGNDRAYATFEYEILGKIKDFLNTLEVKEADLEKGDIKNAFKAGYELGIQQKVQKGE